MIKLNKEIIYISNGFKFVWSRGHGINIYRDDEEVDFINVGDFSRNEATKKEVEEGIKDYIKVMQQDNYNNEEKELLNIISNLNFGQVTIKKHQGNISQVIKQESIKL